MGIKHQLKELLPKKMIDRYSEIKENLSNKKPKKIIEHMEVDFALSRVYDKTKLKVLDIGSHHGEFLEIFGNFNHWHEWEVFCIEPLDQNLQKLEKKVRKFKNVLVTVCPVGISDISEQKTFYLGSADTLFTCSENWNELFPEQFANSREFKINCLTVADLAERYNIAASENFDLIKIDVEGHDFNVIKSFCESKITSTAIIFEISNDLREVTSCIDLLKSKGFNEFYIFGRSGIPTTYIGEYIDDEQISRLRATGRIEVGNVVGFSGNTAS